VPPREQNQEQFIDHIRIRNIEVVFDRGDVDIAVYLLS
jgi:hypothetical protein